jgi:hypothetical protein
MRGWLHMCTVRLLNTASHRMCTCALHCYWTPISHGLHMCTAPLLSSSVPQRGSPQICLMFLIESKVLKFLLSHLQSWRWPWYCVLHTLPACTLTAQSCSIWYYVFLTTNLTKFITSLYSSITLLSAYCHRIDTGWGEERDYQQEQRFKVSLLQANCKIWGSNSSLAYGKQIARSGDLTAVLLW